MNGPSNREPEARAGVFATAVGLGNAALFEALTVPETQDNAIWTLSPWQADPYHAVVGVAQFAVPMLALAIALRLLVRRAPGGPDRAQQMARAAGAMTALIALTLGFEWAAVIGDTAGSLSRSWTMAQVGGLFADSVLTVAVTVLLVRCRGDRGSSSRWQNDWLDDIVFLCRPIPVLRRWARPRAAAWTRRRAMSVFVALSALAGAAFTAAQAIGERVTDPLFIAWMLTAETAGNVAFCLISNAVAGFVARPPRTPARRLVEASLVVGCLAVLAAVAFHDALWSALGSGALTTSALAALTLGAGVATSLITAALLFVRAVSQAPRKS